MKREKEERYLLAHNTISYILGPPLTEKEETKELTAVQEQEIDGPVFSFLYHLLDGRHRASRYATIKMPSNIK